MAVNKQSPKVSSHKMFLDALAALGRDSIKQQVEASDVFTDTQKRWVRLYLNSVNTIIARQTCRPKPRIESLVEFNLDFLSIILPVTMLCSAAQLQNYIKLLCLFADAILNHHGKHGPMCKVPYFAAEKEENLNESLLHAAINVRILTDALAKKPEVSRTIATNENDILLSLTAQQDEQHATVLSLSAREVFERYKSKALLYLNTAECDVKIAETAQYSPCNRFIMQSRILGDTLDKACYQMARAALSTYVITLEDDKKEAKLSAFASVSRKESQYQSFTNSAKARAFSLASQALNETDSLLEHSSTEHESLPDNNLGKSKSVLFEKKLRFRWNASSKNRN